MRIRVPDGMRDLIPRFVLIGEQHRSGVGGEPVEELRQPDVDDLTFAFRPQQRRGQFLKAGRVSQFACSVDPDLLDRGRPACEDRAS